MTSGKQSKAQRRADSQRRAAEKRAAELRQQRMRMATRIGGIVVALAVVVLIVVVATSGSNTAESRHDESPCPHRGHPGLHDVGAGAQDDVAGPSRSRSPMGRSWPR